MTRNRLLALGLGLLLGAVAACSSGDPHGASSAAASGEATDSSRPARVLPLPGAELPADHPPLDAGPTAGGLVWSVPDGWVVEQPSTTLRLAQYRVPGSGGDAECIVFYFGPGQGGDPMANARRWAGQFRQPDGSPSLDRMTMSDLDSSSVPVRLVEITGTYDGGMTMTAAPPEEKPGYMLLGAIAQGADAPWFFKLTGPEATVRAERDSFIRMMRSLRVGE